MLAEAVPVEGEGGDLRVGRPGEAHLEAELERLPGLQPGEPAGRSDGEAAARAGGHLSRPELETLNKAGSV